MRLIDADVITYKEIVHYLGRAYASCTPDVRDLLNDQPTIEAVPVVEAEWEVNGVNPHNMTVGNYRCTACDGISLKNSNFCPNCGARMKGGA